MVARGTLRIYLGAAPGVGKTYSMLDEGRRRAERGTDVVVAFVETHGRALTAARIGDLEVVPRRTVRYRGATFTELDLPAVLGRRPQVALVDELAHTNIPGSPNPKRWQDVEELLDAGIDVISTLNIQHLESVNDVVEAITGVEQRERIPDAVVRRAAQVELVDMAPEAIRRRMLHGNIYQPDRIDAALHNYFRVGNLTALRELALLWVADKVDEGLREYRGEHGIAAVWEARERVVVAVTGGRESDTLIRRAARIAARSARGDLVAVHVSRSDGLTGASPARLARLRELTESLGGTFHLVVGDDVPSALLDFARGANATQLLIGTSRRTRWQRSLSEGVGSAVVAGSGPIDVHMVTHPGAGGKWTVRLPGRAGGLTARRRWYGLALTVIGLPLLTILTYQSGQSLALSTVLLLFLALVVLVALVGGAIPAVLAAVAGSALVNWYFTQPIGTFNVAARDDVIALAVFVLVALAVASVVDLAARRSREAARSRAESEMLAALSRNVLAGERGLTALLEQVRDGFGQRSVTLLERRGDGWAVVGCVGDQPCLRIEDGDADVPVSETLHLVLGGRVLPAADRRVLAAFATQAAIVVTQSRLAEQAAEARALAETDRARTALLAAVSHDLRTPLASIKAAVTSLRAEDLRLAPDDVAELLATVEESADQLRGLVDNLLDMSRLQTGALALRRRPVGLDEVVGRALVGLDGREEVEVDVAETLPRVLADAGLLERAVANVLANALRHGAGRDGAAAVTVAAGSYGGRVELRVTDHGRGVPEQAREQMFAPFQRVGDRAGAPGVGLGLAVAKGFVEAMGGTIAPEETPGGGLTMVLTLDATELGGSGGGAG